MNYQTNKQVKGTERDKFLVKLLLIVVGLLIGASIGMYYAVRTLPLPSQTTVYIPGGQL